jgi:hypothetical protein
VKSGRKIHLTRQKHLEAVALNPDLETTQDVNQATHNPTPAQRARLTFADMLLDSDSEGEPSGDRRAPSPLDNIMMDGNQFYDSAREEIVFSAGTEDVNIRRQELLDGIRYLDYNEHTLFGKMGHQHNIEDDPTISSAVAAMADLGECRRQE